MKADDDNQRERPIFVDNPTLQALIRACLSRLEQTGIGHDRRWSHDFEDTVPVSHPRQRCADE